MQEQILEIHSQRRCNRECQRALEVKCKAIRVESAGQSGDKGVCVGGIGIGKEVRDIVRESTEDMFVLDEADVQRDIDAEDVLRGVVGRQDAVNMV